MTAPRVLGFAGWSGSGKTTLLTAVLPHLTAAGLRVSTLKHAHAGFDIDRPGKDSFRHREAGAHQVLVASARRWALMQEIDGPEPGLDELLALLHPTGLVLVEGFKSSPHPKIEVHRPSLGEPALWPDRPDVVAVATDSPLALCPRPLLPLNDPGTVARWIMDWLRLAPATAAEHVGGPAVSAA